jgi:signal transduction histidine kinase
MMALDPLFRGIRRLPPIVIDAGIAGAIFIIDSIGLLPPHPSTLPAAGLLALAAIGVAFRRRKLWLAFLLVQLAVIVSLVAKVPIPASGLEELVVLYTAAESCGIAASALALLAVLVVDYLEWHQVRSGLDHPVSEWLFLLVVFQDFLWIGFAWYAGRAQNRRRRMAAELEQTANELRQERDRLAEAAVATERARIAQDLHALVVHGLEDMNRETRRAQLRLEGDGTQALEAIVATEARGRETLVQMRRLLSVLRAPSGSNSGLSRFSSRETTTAPQAVPSSAASPGSAR